MRLDDLNTAILEDIRSVLSYDYVVKSDRDGRREYVIGPTLRWRDDEVEIADRFGFSRTYRSANVNIADNSLFIYSTDKEVQDFYVGYTTLPVEEREMYERFLAMRTVQSDVREPIDLSLLPGSIRVMVGSFISQVRDMDFTRDCYRVDVGEEAFLLSMDMERFVYELSDYDDLGDVIARSYSFRELVYALIGHMADRYGFDVDPRMRRVVVGVTDLARVYDFETMETVEAPVVEGV